MSASGSDPLAPHVRELFATLRHAQGHVVAESAMPAAPDSRAELLLGEAGRESLGTRVSFTLQVIDGVLRQVAFRAYGCPHTLAACEWLARRLERQPVDALRGPTWPVAIGTPADWASALEVPPAKLGRLLVIEDALRAALADADESVTEAL